MKKLIVLLIALVVSATAPLAIALNIDDGLSHTFDDGAYQTDWIIADYYTANTPGTHVNLLDDAVIMNLYMHNNATATMTDGTVTYDPVAFDNATINISGGIVGRFIQVLDNGTIYLEGTDFEATDFTGNIMSLSSGDKISNFGTLTTNVSGNDYYAGTITGILNDGTILNNEYRIYNTGIYEGTAGIIIVPEPCSLLLIALGGLILRRKK